MITARRRPYTVFPSVCLLCQRRTAVKRRAEIPWTYRPVWSASNSMHRSDMTLAHVWQCGLHVAVSGVKAASPSRYRAFEPCFRGLKVSPLVTLCTLTKFEPCASASSVISAQQLLLSVIQTNWLGQGGLLLHSNRSPAFQHRRLHMSAQAQVKATNGCDSSPSTAPVALRVMDEALHVEAERSYLAVSIAGSNAQALSCISFTCSAAKVVDTCCSMLCRS